MLAAAATLPFIVSAVLGARKQFLSAEDVVVVLGEAVGFVTDELQEFQAGSRSREFEYVWLTDAVDDLLLLSQ